MAVTADSTRVLLLDSQRDPSALLAQITEQFLASARPVRSVSLLTHGQAGQLWLGSGVVDVHWLDQNADALRRFGRALRGATLDIYGCRVAQGLEGQAFVASLARRTRLAVRASNDLTGRGGDWELEVQSGRSSLAAMAAPGAWLAAFQQQFSGTLVAPVAKAGTAVPVYVLGGAAVTINPGFTLTDADSANMGSATVAIEEGFQAGQDVLAVDTSGTSIAASYDGATGVLTLTGADSVANYQAVLANVTYRSNSATPAGESRIIRFAVTDDMAETDTAAAAVAISGANRRLDGFEEIDFEDYDVDRLAWWDGTSQGQYDWGIVNQHVGGPHGTVVDDAGNQLGQISPGGAEGCLHPTPGIADVLVVEWYWKPVEALVNHAFMLVADDQPANANSWADGAARIIMNNDGNFWVRDNEGWHNLGLAYDQAGHQCRIEFTWAGEDSTWDFYVDDVLVADDYPNYAALGGATGIDRILFRSSDLGNQQFDDIRMSTYTVLNHDPALTLPGGGASYTEDGSGQVIDGGATVSDDEANFNGGRLDARITSGGEAPDRLRVNQTGQVTLSGTTVSVGGTAVGVVNASEVSGGSLLRVTFNANADNAAVQAVARAIAFRSTSQNPSTAQRTVTFTLTDNMGASASASQTVDVVATNDAPIVADVGSQVAQDALPGTLVVSVVAADPDGPGSPSLSLTAGNEEGIFAIDSAGQVTVADAEALYFSSTREFSLTVRAQDGAGLSDTAVVTITVLSVPEPDPVHDGGGDESGDDGSGDGGGDGGTPPDPTPLPEPTDDSPDDSPDDEPSPEPPPTPAPEPDDTTDEESTDDGSDDGSSPDGTAEETVEDPVDDPVEDPLDDGGDSRPDDDTGPDGQADGGDGEQSPSGDGRGGDGDQAQPEDVGQDGQERSVERDAPGEQGPSRRGDPLSVEGPDSSAGRSDDGSVYRSEGPDGASHVNQGPGTHRSRGTGGVSNIDISSTPYDQADPLVRQELVARQSMLERAQAAGLAPEVAQRLAETFGQITRETAQRSRSEANVETVTAAAAGTVTLAASTGYFIWTLQSGGLLASALSAMPAWRWMDPMTILDPRNGKSARRWGRGGKNADLGDEDEQRIARLFDADSRGGKGRG